MNPNSPRCDFPNDGQDQHRHHPTFALNNQSQPCVSLRMFFNSPQDHLGCYDYHHQPLHPYHQSGDYLSYNQGGSSAPEIKSNIESGLKLTLSKKEDHGDDDQNMASRTADEFPKWMPLKMRVIQKMKNLENHATPEITSSVTVNLEDQKFQPSNNHSNNNNSSSFNNSPIRVCSECSTTKTPLWRSGPNGPKSLCNACGIRQRKARRAALAAAAAVTTDQPPAMKIKVQHKDSYGKIKGQVKKRRKTTVAATGNSDRSLPNNGQKKLRFEDFLINLSKKLSFHRKFPEDEKDAAILLMAISSGLVLG